MSVRTELALINLYSGMLSHNSKYQILSMSALPNQPSKNISACQLSTWFYLLTGYYSNAEVVAYHIINPQKAAPPHTLDPRDVLYLWRKLSFRAHQFNTTVIGAPSIDLTHEGNTTLQGHVDGIRELQVWTWMPNFIIRDGRATGTPLNDACISYRLVECDDWGLSSVTK